MKIKIIMVLAAGLALVVGCSKENENTNKINTGQYSMLNGGCYDNVSRTYVAANLCSGVGATGNTGYMYQNGLCYSTTTGQQVQVNYCNNVAGGVNGVNGMYGTQCVGTYIYNQGGYPTYVNCNGTNCRGYTLIEATTQRQVYCQ
jgi:hypothetical protein